MRIIIPFVLFLSWIVTSLIFFAFGRLGQWSRTYVRLASKYCGKSGRGSITYGFPVPRPGLTFDYGRTFCVLRNRKSSRFSSRKLTELSMIWPDRTARLEIATSPLRGNGFGAKTMKPVVIEDPQFQADYFVASNNPDMAKRFLTNSVQWQIEQLRRCAGGTETPAGGTETPARGTETPAETPSCVGGTETLSALHVSLHGGNLVVSKSGYIKQYESLENFVRLALELFDQMMLVDAEGIEFLHQDRAAVVDNVKCPICSEEVSEEMVVCARCKTPHCKDCWQYNGQCATFACCETSYSPVGLADSPSFEV